MGIFSFKNKKNTSSKGNKKERKFIYLGNTPIMQNVEVDLDDEVAASSFTITKKIDEIEAYDLYLFRGYDDLSGGDFLLRSKTNPKDIKYLGRSCKKYIFFHNTMFLEYNDTFHGNIYAVECRSLTTGRTGKHEWFGSDLVLNANGHWSSDLYIGQMQVVGEELILEIFDRRDETPDNPSYEIHISFDDGCFIAIEYKQGSQKTLGRFIV